MRADALADKLLCNNVVGWKEGRKEGGQKEERRRKEVRALNRTNRSLPGVIEGVSGSDKIAELWRQHYSALWRVSTSGCGSVRCG